MTAWIVVSAGVVLLVLLKRADQQIRHKRREVAQAIATFEHFSRQLGLGHQRPEQGVTAFSAGRVDGLGVSLRLFSNAQNPSPSFLAIRLTLPTEFAAPFVISHSTPGFCPVGMWSGFVHPNLAGATAWTHGNPSRLQHWVADPTVNALLSQALEADASLVLSHLGAETVAHDLARAADLVKNLVALEHALSAAPIPQRDLTPEASDDARDRTLRQQLPMFDSTQPDVGFAMGLGSEVVNSRLTYTVASERLAERLSGVSEVTVEELLAWACWMAMNPH